MPLGAKLGSFFLLKSPSTKSPVKDLEKINKTLKAFKNHADIDLIEVTRQGNVESVKLFLDIGANPNVMDEKQETPLFYAAHFGYTEIADLLIQNGANLNLKNHNNWPNHLVQVRLSYFSKTILL